MYKTGRLGLIVSYSGPSGLLVEIFKKVIEKYDEYGANTNKKANL